MEKFVLLLLIPVVLFVSSSKDQPGLKKLDDVVVVFPVQKAGNVKQVRIQVVADNVVKVTTTVVESFNTAPCLMALPQADFNSFTLKHEEQKAVLTTNSVVVDVLLSTGEVIVRETDGKILLQEQERGGKGIEVT